jgi:hypothetical protein
MFMLFVNLALMSFQIIFGNKYLTNGKKINKKKISQKLCVVNICFQVQVKIKANVMNTIREMFSVDLSSSKAG